MRTASLALVLSLVLFLSACSMTATMVPVEGPLSKLVPVPVYSVKVDSIQKNTGKVTFTMAEGDNCKGRWSSAAGSTITLASGSLISQYGSTHLSGMAVTTGSNTGRNLGQAIITCEKGRVIQVEFVTGANTANGYGIAKDNESNVYRLVF